MRGFWDWLSANSAQLQALQLLGLVVAIVVLFFTERQVKYAASQTQGMTVQEAAKASRELFMKVWEDPDLRHMLDSDWPNKDPKKLNAFIGVLIQHYATTFRQWRLGNIPQDYWDEIKSDAKDFFRSPQVKVRWMTVKGYYKQDFQRWVEDP